jgi:transcriptional regulator with XRE-family HTH domain
MRKKLDKAVVLQGERVRRMRQECGFSQEKLAFEAGLDRSYVGGIERGERNITFASLCLIARALGTDVGSLTTGLPKVEL